ncbi:phage terminase large subunit family protein [Halorarius halobius]|uniref:phage terminase large subunit family protein n=1 Tax=Halorarius halobius TaxID=2962671 RepID=UPI0020CBD741|nr:phage terminase large subunit family protein [Halorarius halobius]
MSRPESPSRPARPKGTLFCPTCGHESGLDGDWIAVEGGTLVCPDCGAVVVAQPTFGVPA